MDSAAQNPNNQEFLEKAKKEEAERVAEIYKAPEVLPSPEAVRKIKEPLKPALQPAKPQEVVQGLVANGAVIDKRTGKEKTHRVDIQSADGITRIADLKEQDFIEGVESVHSII